MDKPLYLYIGPSGCGKTTITELLESMYGYKAIKSYTTRKPRYEGENNHIFITEEEFDKLENLVAYTLYNGCKYGTTKEQLDNADLYVLDIPGLETLLQNYANTERKIYVFYLDSTVRTRIDRMTDRHDSDAEIIKRLYNDEAFDWFRKLDHIEWHYKYIEHRDIELYKINANENIENVLAQVLYYMKLQKDKGE